MRVPTFPPISSAMTMTARDIVIQAHRGAGQLAPENSLKAFELAWQLGYVPEADVQSTRDGVLVAYHDDDVPPDALPIASVFAAMQGHPDRRLYLDVKRANLAQLAGEIEQHDIARQIILASPHHHLLRHWKARVPKSSTLLWMGGSEAELNGRLAELSELKFAEIDQLQIHVHLRIDAHAIARDTSDPFVESDAFLAETANGLRRWGILFQVLPYGGSTPAVYWKLLDLGVQSFATDHPDVTWDAVRKYYEAGK